MTIQGGAAISRTVAADRPDSLLEARMAEQYVDLIRLACVLAGNQADAEDAVQGCIGTSLAWPQPTPRRGGARWLAAPDRRP